jgi:prepilin-type N-terminal cleavage/methylation domain-containing protein
MDTAQIDCGLRIADCGFGNRLPSIRNPKSETRNRAFTLVELLVVITIIGILAALIVVAAVGALKKANETRTKAELNQMAGGIDEYRNKANAYPPNCQTDDKVMTGGANPLDETGIFNDLKRHMRQAFPRNQESDNLLRALIGQQVDTNSADKANYPQWLDGGMTAGEALVFWLGGFSSDPKYPISGDGGPAYLISAGKGNSANRTQDPIESRKWVYPFDISRLIPRATDGYFDESVGSGRFVEFQDAKGQWRRINFWQYTPAKSEQPYLYFDTSRHPAGVVSGSNLTSPYDPPAATANSKLGPSQVGLFVYAFKKQNPSYSSTNPNVPAVTYVNPDKFQILHCGIDDHWDADDYSTFAKIGTNNVGKNDPSKFLLFPAGPFTGEIADTIVNFITETRIEDAPKP